MERARFLSILRQQIQQAKNWPRVPDRRLRVEKPPGWMLPILVEAESACWGRWDHWLRTVDAGHVLDEPIPPIRFDPTGAALARRMHEKALDCIPTSGGWQGWGSWRIFDYYLDWLLYAFGHPGYTTLPDEPEEGAFSRLYQVFCLEAMIAWPTDIFGDLLAENRHGRQSGFFPTPHDVVEVMTKLTFAEGEDSRLKSFLDPCSGTGRILLHASNHTYVLYGQEINATVLKASLVNGYAFAPWLVRPCQRLRPAPSPEPVFRLEADPPPPNRRRAAWNRPEQLPLFDDAVNELTLK